MALACHQEPGIMRQSLSNIYFSLPILSLLPPILTMLPSNLRWMALAVLAIRLLSMRPLWVSAQESTAVCLSQFNWVGLLCRPDPFQLC